MGSAIRKPVAKDHCYREATVNLTRSWLVVDDLSGSDRAWRSGVHQSPSAFIAPRGQPRVVRMDAGRPMRVTGTLA